MRSSRRARLPLAAALALVAGGALAQTPGPSPEPAHAPPAAGAARRFPQPVRAGSLLDRRLLEPREDQPVLGRVAGLVRGPDGGTGLVVTLGGWLGLGLVGTRRVAVPLEAVALLGEHVALMDLTPAQLRALPTFDPAAAPGIPPDQTLQVGIVRPFH